MLFWGRRFEIGSERKARGSVTTFYLLFLHHVYTHVATEKEKQRDHVAVSSLTRTKAAIPT